MLNEYDYAKLFDTQQYKQLYIISNNRWTREIFSIYILPKDEKGISFNILSPGMLNKGAVKVYGLLPHEVNGYHTYGWLHKGIWQQDFEKLAKEKQEQTRLDALDVAFKEDIKRNENKRTTKEILGTYSSIF